MNRVNFMMLYFWLIALTVQSQNITHDHSFICGTQIDENSNNLLNLNNPGAISSNGQDLTPRGTQRVLVVFAGFEGFEITPDLDGWSVPDFNPGITLPDYVTIDNNGNTRTTYGNRIKIK